MPVFSPLKRRSFSRGLAFTATLLLSLGLCACGAGGTEDTLFGRGSPIPSTGNSTLRILTTGVPDASRDIGYPSTSLSATGARGPVSWALSAGNLPIGMSLTNDGRLVGVPATTGFYEFTVRVSDGVEADLQALAVAVDTFGVTVIEGLQFGDAWGGRPVVLSCSGFTGPVEMDIVSNESGGYMQSANGSLGDAVWVPGWNIDTGATDTLRARDTGTGATAHVDLQVVRDPADTHVARFGSTDVWYLDFDCKHGAHQYASDFHFALAALGLRSSAGSDRLGSEADQLADLLVRVRTLAQINQIYERNADGTAGPSGLGISFPLVKPGTGYTLPAPGSFAGAAANRFNVMAVCDGTNRAVVGTAYTDAVGNQLTEHNAPGGPMGSLGTFINVITVMVKNMYRDHGPELLQTPVNASDVPALKALLYGQPSPGDRYEALDYVTNALARSIAYIAAHEIGHSLGLPHNSSPTPGAVMNTGATFSPYLTYRFLPGALGTLRVGLPGPGRGVGSQTRSVQGRPAPVAAATLPAGGVHVCGGECHSGR